MSTWRPTIYHPVQLPSFKEQVDEICRGKPAKKTDKSNGNCRHAFISATAIEPTTNKDKLLNNNEILKTPKTKLFDVYSEARKLHPPELLHSHKGAMYVISKEPTERYTKKQIEDMMSTYRKAWNKYDKLITK